MISNSLDLAAWWMPFTANKAFKDNPRMIASAEGMYFRTLSGRLILDAAAGLWCVNAGHRPAPIVAAMHASIDTLDYAPPFGLGHPDAFALAEMLASRMPPGLDRIFFTGSGSESVDTALKIALAYQRSIGQGTRTRFIGRERGYHGVGFGGMSVGGLVNNRRSFGPLLPAAHLRHTHDIDRAFTRGEPECGAELAEDLERLVHLYGADTIAAVIVEPVAGSTGVLVPPKGYLARLREIASTHGILLIFDEVITAFGRLGASTAADRFGVKPDLITMAKGLTNGAVPMGAVAVSRGIYDSIVGSVGDGIEFFHGYTYSGHPLAAAAGLATLAYHEAEDLNNRVVEMESHWSATVHGLRDAAHVIDIRNLGLVAGIELSPRPEAPGARAAEVFQRCFDSGLLVRVMGDTIALSPPLIITRDQVEEVASGLRAALQAVA